MRRELFGTDGVRGVAKIEPMPVETAMALGQAVAYSFRNHSGRHKIVIGKDTRLSGYMFETALSAGICSMGGGVVLVGAPPLPADRPVPPDRRRHGPVHRLSQEHLPGGSVPEGPANRDRLRQRRGVPDAPPGGSSTRR